MTLKPPSGQGCAIDHSADALTLRSSAKLHAFILWVVNALVSGFGGCPHCRGPQFVRAAIT